MRRGNPAAAPAVSVLMVCLGNICRSPTAHGVMEKHIENSGLSGKVIVDSAGTGDWHAGEGPDRRAAAAAGRRGYRLDHLRARQVAPDDFGRFDYILAMDHANLKELQRRCPAAHRAKLALFLAYGGLGRDVVPDPYYTGGRQGFELVLDLVEDACEGLLAHIRERHFPEGGGSRAC